MAYDNTKLDAAVSRWIKRDCSETFGETYAGDLQASFEAFCADTGALKRSPGRVAFGAALGRREYEKRKVCGLTYYGGLILKEQPEVSVPRENTKSEDTAREAARQERERKLKKEEEQKKAARKKRAAEVKERMQQESKDHNIQVGQKAPEPLPADPD